MDNSNNGLLEQLRQLLKHKKSRAFYAERLGISVGEVDELLVDLRSKSREFFNNSGGLGQEAETATYISELEERVVKHNKERGTIESEVITTFEPKNDQELAELHKVDLTKYKISSYWTKQRGEKFTSSLLCTLIKPNEFNDEKFSQFLSSYKPSPIRVTRLPKDSKSGELVDVEVSLSDVHLDKLVTTPEGIEERKQQYFKILEELLHTTTVYNVRTIAFIIGNDVFHTDTIQGTTTGGTPMDISTTWFNAYEQGFDLLVRAIAMVKEYAKNVEVILVQGNHSRTKEYYLAHALEIFFKEVEDIWFDRTAKPLKYTVLGNTFIGYHHGNCKIDELPLVFATDPESSIEFGTATFREIHTGDKHHYASKEIKGSGVRVMQLPALCGNDRWHEDGNFIHQIRAGLAMVYSPTKGKIAEFESRI